MSKRKESKGGRPHKLVPLRKEAYASLLNRQPRKWDMLIFELAMELAEQCRRACPASMEKTLRFAGEELWIVGWMLARGFDVLVREDWPREEGDEPVNLWPVEAATAEAAAKRAGRSCFGPLLRKYVLDQTGKWLGRGHRDVLRLVGELEKALRGFLLKRGAEGGDLHSSIVDPLGDHGGYFEDNEMPPGPERGAGNPRRDVQLLGVTIEETDDPTALKGRLIEFVRVDPWLSEELVGRIEEGLAEVEEEDEEPNLDVESVQIGDDFLFSATHLGGKTPIEVLVERQPGMSERQRERLLRWSEENFYGVFLVEAVRGDFLELVDARTDRRLRVTGERKDLLRQVPVGGAVVTRVLPWDDYWVVSGGQMVYPDRGPEDHEQLRRAALLTPMWRPASMRGPHEEAAKELAAERHAAWMELFGRDELVFESGEELQAALHQYERYWAQERRNRETGLTRAQMFEKERGKPWEPPPMDLEEDLLEAEDVAVIYSVVHGMDIHTGYGLFRSAFEQGGVLTGEQVKMVWDYLSDEGTSAYLFERMRERYGSERMEAVLRQVLADETFEVRDFEKLLRTFKGQSMRRPPEGMTVTG